jgi:hypothetical protein
MKIQDITRFLGIFVGVAVIFFLGYLAGNRDKYDKIDEKVQITAPNSSIQNSLSLLKTKDIFGFGENNTTVRYGLLYYKTLPDKSTELFFTITNSPLVLRQTTNKIEKTVPINLKISLARTSIDGQKYDYTDIGKITFEEPKNGTQSVIFSTIIPGIKSGSEIVPALNTVSRIVFRPTRTEDENIFKLNSPDIPPDETAKPAPYFWAVMN